MNKVIHGDCMEYMKDCKDNQFDLAIVDPPYGIGESKKSYFGKKRSKSSAAACGDYACKDWDDAEPSLDYWVQLFRISKNQIVWGCNYYSRVFIGGRIYWDKVVPEKYSKSKGELAFQSFNRITEYFKYTWNGMIQEKMHDKEKRIHPTQKPIDLYKWLLQNYAKPGQTIFDSHVGSGSIRIACHDLGFNFTGCELDLDYFKAQEARYQAHIAQSELFGKEEIQGLVYNK